MFAPFNWVPTLLIVVLMPVVFIAIRPAGGDVTAFTPEAGAPAALAERPGTPAGRMDRSPVGSLFLLATGLAVVGVLWVQGHLALQRPLL